MEQELELQIPRWQLQETTCGGCRLRREDALGRVCTVRLCVYPRETREQAAQLCESLDTVRMLAGGANLVCHQDHWARQADDGWEVCVLEADLQSLEEYCAARSAGEEELIILPSEPELAALALSQYLEKRRIPEETVLRIGCDICRALEQCREKGLEQCAVTMQTIRVSPGGDFVLTGMGIPSQAPSLGTQGLAQVLCGLLGGENGKCAFGEEGLRALVEQACREQPDVKEFWSALDRLAHGQSEVERQKELIRQLQEDIAGHQQAQQEKEQQDAQRNALIQQLQGQLLEHRNQKELDSSQEPEPAPANPWSKGGSLDQKPRGFAAAQALPPEPARDYTAVIRQKMALSAVISAGVEHSVVLLNNGTAAASGKNTHQQCKLSNWRSLQAIAAGDGHTVGLTTEGRVVAAGQNGYGQCSVGSWQDIVQICAGSFHTVGLKRDGTVLAAGSKANDRCDVGSWRNIAALAVGVDHTVGLKSDGTVVAVGSNRYGQCDVRGWRDIVQVAAGAGHTVGLKADGTAVATGWEHYSKCAVEDWTDIVAIAAGSLHTLGLKRNGTVVAVGNTGGGRCDVAGWRDVAAIAAGRDHSLAVCVDGTVLTAGSNAAGQCDLAGQKNACVPGSRMQPLAEPPVKTLGKDYSQQIRERAERGGTISAGQSFSVCVLEGGTVQSTGQVNTRIWRAVRSVAAGADFCLGLRANGKLLAAGSNTQGQCSVEKWDNIIQVAAGTAHAVGLRSDGIVVTAGNNGSGQRNTVYWNDIAAIAAGCRHTVGLRKDGTAVATGDNSAGQCNVGIWKDIVAIAAGEAHTVGLKTDGTVVAAGDNSAGQCDVGSWRDMIAVAAGKDHTVGLKKDGTVLAVGRTAYNQCAVGRWKDIVAIAAGQCYTLGLRADGSMVATGLNASGQCKVTGWRKVKLPEKA